jgi:methylase of polypeptide subunit release factors
MIPEPDPALACALATDLAAAGYTGARLRALWGVPADEALGRGRALPARREVSSSASDVAVLAKLFFLGSSVPEGDAERALRTVTVSGAERLGLVLFDTDTVEPLVLIRPQAYVDEHGAGEWWIASDIDESVRPGALPEHHVLGVGGASLTLAGLQLPTPAARVLDLGSGCGIQSLRARRDSPDVTATDISPAALRFTRLNALLNGVEGIRTLEGSLFAPIGDEVFDRIVSNPPFVITPRDADVPAYEYRDGGLTGDALVRDIVTEVGAHLTPGGTAQLLGNWEYVDGRDGLHRVRDWVATSDVPLDAWIIERDRMDPIAYAELWIRDGGTVPGTPEFESMLAAWLDDFEARGVREIGFGYILLRRAVDGRPSLSRYERVEGAIGPNAALGMHLAESLRTHDRQVALSDDELAASVLLVAGDVTEARHYLPGAEDPSVIELRQGGGFGRTLAVDPALAALVGASDGDLPVGRLISAIAELLEVDAEPLLVDLLPRVRGLLDDGFLAFAAHPGSAPASPSDPPR